jgi:ethanolamine utilization protein EutQ (cupin superfamily)
LAEVPDKEEKQAMNDKVTAVQLLREEDVPYIDFTRGMKLSRAITAAGSTVLGGGWVKMDGSGELKDWTLPYDEALYVVRGELTIDCEERSTVAGPGQAILMAHGSKVSFKAKPDTVGFFALFPRDWRERQDRGERVW